MVEVATIREIPTYPETPRYDLRVVAGERAYLLDVDYVGAEDRWYVKLSTAEGEPIAGPQKVVCDVPMFRRKAHDPRLPQTGYFVFLTLDARGLAEPPGWLDFGRRVRLYLRDG